LRLLGLNPATSQRSDAEQALLSWRAIDFESATANMNLVATALRRFDEWDATPQGRALGTQPLFTIDRIGELKDAPPLALPALRDNEPPLSGLRVLDLTRILAGPVGGRALAAYGADVMLINSPNLPNIAAIADTSRGKLSAHADLRTDQGRAALDRLVGDAHVFVQGYRPGGLSALGYGVEEVVRLRPGIIYVSLSAYGTQGPWAQRRGFDSLAQTAMGFNHAEGEAAGDSVPRPMPMQILDEATGYLLAFGVAAALFRQQRKGLDLASCVRFATVPSSRARQPTGSGHQCRPAAVLQSGLRTGGRDQERLSLRSVRNQKIDCRYLHGIESGCCDKRDGNRCAQRESSVSINNDGRWIQRGCSNVCTCEKHLRAATYRAATD